MSERLHRILKSSLSFMCVGLIIEAPSVLGTLGHLENVL